MKRYRFRYKETIVTILADDEKYFKVAIDAILEARSEIERFIALNPEFLVSYTPMDCEGRLVGRMCRASRIAEVGPMAAVAGTIASFAVERMVESGAELAVVDNGGDIVLHSDTELTVGLYPSNIAFKLEPKELYAVCTSSGKIGHSVSFGYADAATIFGEDASIADALATALGNEVGENFGKNDLKDLVERFWDRYKKFIDGLFVVKDDIYAFAGNIPEITEAKIEPELITKG
jgi:hypothetical protein